MQTTMTRSMMLAAVGALALPMAGSLSAQVQGASDPSIVINGQRLPDPSQMTPGPEIKGTITARNGDKIKVLGTDGNSHIIVVNDQTVIKGGNGLFGGSHDKPTTASLLNGLPVKVKTLQWSDGLLATQVNFKGKDLKVASMIRNGTAQGFEEQTAATEALRGRLGDIDKYNIKGTTNVYFDTGKAVLSESAKADLCAAATQADGIDNALMLVVGYTDSVGSDDTNQALSEKRANRVINYLQQVCHWKPYRMLTPTGMAKADPLASNDTPEGRAQNRRVAVNILVSKSVDGI